MSTFSPINRQVIERAPRFAKSLQIKASTFGSKDPYELTAINISYSGLLVGSEVTPPFQLKTLLELEIILERDDTYTSIHCLGKIVRSAKGDSRGLSEYIAFFDDVNEKFLAVFGIQILEITEGNLRLWRQFIDSLRP